MRVTHVSYFYDPEIRTPAELIARYSTLRELARAIQSAGQEVSVVQRFHADGSLRLGEVDVRFVRDATLRPGSLLDRAARVNRAVAETRPDVVHAHGLGYVRQAARLRGILPGVPLLAQDHANGPPTRRLDLSSFRMALQCMNMVTFASVEQAAPWAESGLLGPRTLVADLMEGSSHFAPVARETARARTGLRGDPLCLWVGRLNPNKDPITALEGFARAAPMLRDGQLAMVFHEAPLRQAVEGWLASHPEVAGRVHFLGRVPHEALEALFSSADIYLSASRREGSGYALIEALACGATPVVTDIPSFRALTGCARFGALWAPGDCVSCARALVDASLKSTSDERRRIRDHFERSFSYGAIARRATELYEMLAARPLAGARP